ncbi:ANTAR domain-containing response regulator [Mangrovibrevibacter kandeliae]|uniref:ANTAR domain-containing response regulator n=1 Tax=Mangrovibrevibacter kandeliae TaxID=2968473 RepID=UPI0021193DAC|nr:MULTISPECIES: ANTAR domain-containing protein [unclassified Aurantimonas]MCQ8781047.1 ANTAR domain-containing protein [Aurantimonas sp. CSK15Z-1]MCW4113829.1 ANTAR domain-containing protein [Aurantimonas sp. MSK8Z-1]
MRQRRRIPNLGGARAVILHRPHPVVAAITRQLAAIGLVFCDVWPELPAEALGADFVFFDADLGFDEQFPWTPGEAPMPLVALIGSEAPGRVEWAMSHRADSHLVKGTVSAGVYSALLIAKRSFEERHRLAREVAALTERIGERQTIVRAVMALARDGIGEAQAYAQLRALAMSWQMTLEAAAGRVVALGAGEGEGRDDRSHRA